MYSSLDMPRDGTMAPAAALARANERPGKALAYVAALAVTVVVASPAWQNLRPADKRLDDFPLSYYPMFSVARTATGKVHHLIGIDAAGDEHVLHFRHAGSGGLNQVRRQINRRVREGRADVVAALVATSVGTAESLPETSVKTVRVVTSKHRFDDFFAGDRIPRSRVVLAEATVARPATA